MGDFPYDTYVFDLYGTLADIWTDEESPRLWAAFSWDLRLRGAQWAPKELKEAWRRLCAESLAEKEAALKRKGLEGPGEADIHQVFRRLGALRGVRMSQRETDDLARHFRALSLRRLRLYPGAKELLAALRAAGKRVILLTNAQSAFTVPELRCLGIGELFDHILISSDFGAKKPSPAFFASLSDCGVEADRAVMIGNDDESDCRGAARFGMDSLYLQTAQSPPLSGPLPENCRRIPSLSALLLHEKGLIH